MTVDREEANRQAMQRLGAAEPTLVDIGPALEVVPGMAPDVVLTAGASLPWDQYSGLQRARILEAAVAEGLAGSADEADRKLAGGAIRVASAHQHGCIGPGMAICTASMPVFVVENRAAGNRAFSPVIGPDFRQGACPDDGEAIVHEMVVPVVGEAIRSMGGVALQPIVASSLRLGDELHLRAGGATTLFTTAIFPALLDVARQREEAVRETLGFLERNGQSWFVRLGLAAGKAMADATHGVPGSSLVTAIVQNCRELAIRVSGLDDWFAAPLPAPDGTRAELPGGDATLADSIALGDPRPQPRGDLDPAALVYWGFRSGIDVFKVLGTGVLPPLTGHCTDERGALAGAVVARVPMVCFEAASAAYRREHRKPARS